ncbi:epoxide hydrolase, putative [Paecilomyces variotii No. 5]|uniref:Epoxide hydrolase, putative n=1 Tax=Byssochlamys spectabilis (strain No. 5 / NBRC 109023) TaxID=1356009 RepID=V5G6N0_BYSSN|nr:epoxide hydrolase, putative [Paecilomyces variotii No. 5]
MTDTTDKASPIEPLPLPAGVTSRKVQTAALSFHILEAGYSAARDRPLVVLLHGFPELAFSWRKVIPRLADAGFYVVAPDQRGFGRTTGWDNRSFELVDLATFSLTTLVRDIVVLVHALGYHSVRCVVGHDSGAVSAAMCALVRPDFFRSVVLLSHPFNGTPALPFNTANDPAAASAASGSGGAEGAAPDVHGELAALGRKHYKWYYSTESANTDMMTAAHGLQHFLRGYFHLKSGSWARNDPHPLRAWTASELAQLPYYYIMPSTATMPEAVALEMANEPPVDQLASHSWLPDTDLAVYVAEYARTTFQGGLNWSRVRTAAGGRYTKDLETFAGKKIEVPCAFISGRQDWGTYQEPGAVEKMVNGIVCTDFRFSKIVDGAGHWVPQEKPEEVVEGILQLINSTE